MDSATLSPQLYELFNLLDEPERSSEFLNFTFSPEEQARLNYVQHVFVAITVTLMTIGIIGNLLVLWTVIRSRSLHFPMYMTVASLGVCDILTLCVNPITVFMFDGVVTLKFNKVTCYVQEVLARSFPLAGSIHFILISLERYIAVRFPFQARAWLTKRRALMAAATAYVVSLVLHFYLFTMMKFGEFGCKIVRTHGWQNWYELVLNILRAIIPLVVLIFLNMNIAQVLIEKTTFRLKISEATVKKVSLRTSANTMALSMMAVVVILFVFLNWPICIMAILLFALPNVNIFPVKNPTIYTMYVCMTVGRLCLYLNSTINPIIYTMVSYNFRSRLRSSFRKFGTRDPSFISSSQPQSSQPDSSVGQSSVGQSSNKVTRRRSLMNVQYRRTPLERMYMNPSVSSLDSQSHSYTVCHSAVPSSSSVPSIASVNIAQRQLSRIAAESSYSLQGTPSAARSARWGLPHSAARLTKSSDAKMSDMTFREFSSKLTQPSVHSVDNSAVQREASDGTTPHVDTQNTTASHIHTQNTTASYTHIQNTTPPHVNGENTTASPVNATNSPTQSVDSLHTTRV